MVPLYECGDTVGILHHAGSEQISILFGFSLRSFETKDLPLDEAIQVRFSMLQLY